MLRFAVIAVFFAAGAAHAGEVYKWKDASGATHYTQKPPAKGAFSVVKVNDKAPTPAASTTAAPTAARSTNAASSSAASATKDNAACERARANLAVLTGKTTVQMDSDGDGKPDKTLNDTERANHLELANAAIKANCTQ